MIHANNHAQGRASVPKSRRLIACNYCRLKKVRCDGRHPCTNCLDHDESCVYATRRRHRQGKSELTKAMAERLARVEALLKVGDDSLAQVALPATKEHEAEGSTVQVSLLDSHGLFDAEAEAMPSQDSHPANLASLTSDGQGSTHQIVGAINTPPGTEAPSDRASSQSITFNTVLSDPTNPSSSLFQHDVESGKQQAVAGLASPSTLLSGDIEASVAMLSEADVVSDPTAHSPEGNSVYSGELSNWEYHGPRSFLSICSKSGIQWVLQKTGNNKFQESAALLTKSITQRLKIETKMWGQKTPEPSAEAARRYTTMFFEHAREASFEVVSRAWFEGRLESALGGRFKSDDPAWYALRNVIYATGARIELSRTSNFRTAFQTAWSFFSNCLSVHIELLYFRTSLMAVQALTLMGYFSESIANPCLEYMLSTVALRLACSKGMHRHAAPSWNMSQDEQNLRNRIFWAAYCLEKNCSAKSGRPSMLDDDQISCQMPTPDSPDASSTSMYSIALIKLAQMASVIGKRLTHVETLKQPPDELAKAIRELDKQLESLKEFLQQLVEIESPLEPHRRGAKIDSQQAVYIRMAYYITVLDLHTTITYPWTRGLLNLSEQSDLHDQIKLSSDIVAKTARNAIQATQFVCLNATTSILMGFHGPLYAMINLFTHILQQPEHATVQSDLALIEIGASHFLRLEFSTDSEVSFPFSRDLATLARHTVEHRKKVSVVPDGMGGFMNRLEGMSNTDEITESNEMEGSLVNEFPPNFFDLDMEHCSTFLPTSDFDDILPSFFNH